MKLHDMQARKILRQRIKHETNVVLGGGTCLDETKTMFQIDQACLRIPTGQYRDRQITSDRRRSVAPPQAFPREHLRVTMDRTIVRLTRGGAMVEFVEVAKHQIWNV